MVLYVWPLPNEAEWLTVRHYERFWQVACFGEAVLSRASPCKCAESQADREHLFAVIFICQLRAVWRNS